ncbi:Mbov_0401 family ICE element transposase-like protein [Spiroplasma endosymbiont of Nebria brevicollis]|uniref:Mbov_0401 family ICE element transposase-like protein n=1 Tax=Spiroplasma endosymbiont of Nebria brevicollis TaxID=3066284 RepID=UPI00313B591F
MILNSFKDINFVEEVNIDVNFIEKQKLKEKYENLDQELRKQNCNGQNGYILWGTRNKKMKTPFGDITIKASRFCFYDKKENKFKTTTLLNKEIGLKNNQTIILSVKISIWKEMDSAKRQRDIRDMFPKLNISNMSITNINKEVNFYKLFQEHLKTKTRKVNVQTPYLYAGVDDSFSNLTKYKKIEKNMFRVAYFHTGYDEIKSTKNKNVLRDKNIFIVMKSVKNKYYLIQKYKKEFLHFLHQNYNIENCKLTLAGDGATWIQKFANEIGAIYILDEFHLMKELKTIFPYRRKKLTKNLTDNEKIRKEIKKFINYINKRKDGIKVYKENWYMGSCTESQISHNVKWLKGYGAKLYSEKVFKNMIAMKMAKENGINLIGFYLEKINKKLQKEHNYYFKNNDNYQFLINKNVSQQARVFI